MNIPTVKGITNNHGNSGTVGVGVGAGVEGVAVVEAITLNGYEAVSPDV